MGGQQPMALSGQQGGQPYYNFSMMQSPEDDPWNMMQGAGSQLGAGQVSGGIGPAASSYPSLGGTPPGAWGPSQYDPNIVEAGPGQVVTKPGGGPPSPTDPVGGGPIFNKPAEMPEIPDYGPPPDIPPGPSFGGDMTLPGGETVPGGSPTPGGGEIPSTGGGRPVMTKGGPGLGQMSTGLAERKRDLGGGGGGGGGWQPNRPLPQGWQQTTLPGGTVKRWGPQQPGNTLMPK